MGTSWPRSHWLAILALLSGQIGLRNPWAVTVVTETAIFSPAVVSAQPVELRLGPTPSVNGAPPEAPGRLMRQEATLSETHPVNSLSASVPFSGALESHSIISRGAAIESGVDRLRDWRLDGLQQGGPEEDPEETVGIETDEAASTTPKVVEKVELKCHDGRAPEETNETDNCPSECPYFAEIRAQSCRFMCVTADECGSPSMGLRPKQNTADMEMAQPFCRTCTVSGCLKCKRGADECLQCLEGWKLHENGSCSSVPWWPLWLVIVCCCVFAVYVFMWYIEMCCCRKVVNLAGVAHGLKYRSWSKLRKPKFTSSLTEGTFAGTAEDTDSSSQEQGGDPAEPAASAVGDGAAEDDNVDNTLVSPEQRVSRKSASQARRSSARASMKKAASKPAASTRQLWPLSTNLMQQPAGGAGNVLLFRFMMFVVVWPFVVLCLWILMTWDYNPEIFMLGLRVADTPRRLCRIVVAGHQAQMDQMTLKVEFLGSVYWMTFIGHLVFCCCQQRKFRDLDRRSSMRAFGALLTGVPKLPGTIKVEEELKTFIQEQTGQAVVGVSVGWNVCGNEEAIRQELEMDLFALAPETPPDSPRAAEERRQSLSSRRDSRRRSSARSSLRAGAAVEASAVENERRGEAAGKDEDSSALGTDNIETVAEMNEEKKEVDDARSGLLFNLFWCLDNALFTATGVSWELPEIDAPELLKEMRTSFYAYVVFETQVSREKSIGAFKYAAGGIKYRGGTLGLRRREAEPDAVQWDNFIVAKRMQACRVFWGVLMIVLAMIVWFAVAYLPYIVYMSSSIDSDSEGAFSIVVGLIMTCVVTLGNIIMYLVCGLVADWVQFHYVEQRETLYMISYFFAVVGNVLADLIITGRLTYNQLVAAEAHTFSGKALSDLDNFQEIVESYPLQKTFGEQLFSYCFPSTFLLPFLIEPFATIFFPYHLARLIGRSRVEIRGIQAQRLMAPFTPQDSGRYADLLINVNLAVLIFFVPSGWIHWTYVALTLSHIYIFCMDYYKVLRCVPSFCFARSVLDDWAQILFTIPTGMILGLAVFKANCHLEGGFCLHGGYIFMFCCEVFLIHCCLHFVLLKKLVPCCVSRNNKKQQLKYEQVSEGIPSNWFNTNPVYCWRSKHLYQHNPPCRYYVPGKEHLLEANAEIGQHFQDVPPCAENYLI